MANDVEKLWRILEEMLLVSEPPEAPIMRIVGFCMLLVSGLVVLYLWSRQRTGGKR